MKLAKSCLKNGELCFLNIKNLSLTPNSLNKSI